MMKITLSCMRTTLTLDDDLAVALEWLRRTRGGAFKTLVNEALREGLKNMCARPTRREPFRTQAVDFGSVRVGSVDNIGEGFAIAEGEPFK